MKRKFIGNIAIMILLSILFFTPSIQAAEEYSVYHIDTTSKKTLIANASSYEQASSLMMNYPSTVNDVAVIFRNGKMVNAMYGVFRFNNASTVTFSTDYGPRYISPSYNSEALLLGYNPANNTVMIKMSGVVGWISADMGTVQPISYLTTGGSNLNYDTNKNYLRVIATGGLRLREGPGTNYTQIGCGAGVTACSASSGGIFASEGAIYEWVNKGNIPSDGKYEWYQININGSIGYIAHVPSDPYVEEFNPATGNREENRTYYTVNSSGNLIHTFYATVASSKVSSVNLGLAPLWLKQGVTYYSYDGNYFYSDFTKMVTDYRNGNTKGAINRYPYYNYYQYMPSRTKTVYTADNINNYLSKWYSGKINRDDYYSRYYDEATGKYKWQLTWNWDTFAPGLSMLYGEGGTYINSQETYGVNGAQTFALSINESAWGRSYISVREYNVFGHGAFDSNPDAFATGYNTVADGIIAHARKYIAGDYDNPVSGSHYYGGHYGNKLSGNNVSYASDAYWGEKMASQYAAFDRNYDYQEFRNKITIGIKRGSGHVPVMKDPNTSSTTLYNLSNCPDVPVAILGEVKGTSIGGNDIWYKVQSDVPLDSNRNVMDPKASTYNYDTSYAYIHSSYLYVESQAPIIEAQDITLSLGGTFDAMKNVSAYDPWDGVIGNIKTVSNVNTKIPGDYQVTYTATDSEGNTATKVIKVSVISTEPIQTAGDYYFEYLKEIDGKLVIKGFQTIKGVSNALDHSIDYQLIFRNSKTNEEIVKSLTRITNKNDMPFELGIDGGYDYTYSWFTGVIDIQDLSNGDYSLYIKANDQYYYSISALSNVFGKEMSTGYQANNKSVFIRNNYESREAAIQFFVRSEKIGEKTTSSRYNMLNEYSKIAFENQRLIIRGASHSINGDYAVGTAVERNMIFENINTYAKKSVSVGSITTGDYKIELRVSDGLDKTRAWYEASIDLEKLNLDKGTYAIYLSTKSNFSDYGELQNIFGTAIPANITLNSKSYRFEVDKTNRYRVLLIVE